ncbi:MAG TPA: hypothetical protein VFC00_41045 [Micromonosporaceae bacterium]|nr:hypothetical protein [Micromonosporaceae bacterium]
MRKLLLALAALPFLAACGDGGSPGAAPSADARAQLRATTNELVQCVRSNGAPDLPDPVFDEQGLPQFPENTDPGNNPKVQAAIEGPCRPIAERLDAMIGEAQGDRQEEQRPIMSAEDQAKLRQYAQCMRDNGMPDWPDADPTGRFLLPSSYPEGLGKGDRPMDRTFLAALAACEPLSVEGTSFG